MLQRLGGGWDDCPEAHEVGHVGGLQGWWAGKKMYLWAAVLEEGKGRGPCWGEVPELDPGG